MAPSSAVRLWSGGYYNTKTAAAAAMMVFWLINFQLYMNDDVAAAAPITLPDLSVCQKATASSPIPGGETQVLECCLPYKDVSVVDFTFERYPAPKKPRVRRAAHLADNETIARLNKAYEIMKSFDREDPRSFRAQANIHCAFCNGAYFQPGTNITLQVHFSWLFLPWHRMYLYFHERILASLIGDDPDNPSFGLLYWNWDNQVDDLQSNIMPPAFNIKDSAIYDAKRNKKHRPPERIRLNVGSNETTTNTKEEIINENLNVMYQSIVTASNADMFMGGAYRLGTDFSTATVINAPMSGSIEQNAHSGIHFWTGDPDRKLRSNMGVFTLASRDPIFYAHHSNVDRLWDVWSSLPGGRRTPPTDADFLDAEFYFYDENSNLVRCKVRDFLDNEKLGVSYAPAAVGDDAWINYRPQPTPTTLFNGSAVAYAKSVGVPIISSADDNATSQSAAISIGSNFTALVKRGAKPANNSDLDEVLVIQGVQLKSVDYVHLKVFVNMPQATVATPIFNAEYVGSYNVVPSPSGKLLYYNIMLEIADNLKILGLQNDEYVVVTILVDTLLPDSGGVTINGMKIEYD